MPILDTILSAQSDTGILDEELHHESNERKTLGPRHRSYVTKWGDRGIYRYYISPDKSVFLGPEWSRVVEDFFMSHTTCFYWNYKSSEKF